ncbi:MAG: xanthine phosphoribosyltransferase [Chloroflexi bacterium]|nr:xanthine phosphoribosyltransferase [Chloroflexota bacterium]
MNLLKQRILDEGKNLGRGILKIDSFLNHQIDAELMMAVGEYIAAQLVGTRPSRVLTAEVSGLIPAAMVGKAMGNIPVVYARKHKPITMMEPVYIETAPSHTKGNEVSLMVSPEFLHAGEQILIVDDFLATGRTIDALCRIVQHAGAELVGIAAVVEKTFEGGREVLSEWNVPIVAAAMIIDMSDGKIILA